jgi:hypothetical protein
MRTIRLTEPIADGWQYVQDVNRKMRVDCWRGGNSCNSGCAAFRIYGGGSATRTVHCAAMPGMDSEIGSENCPPPQEEIFSKGYPLCVNTCELAMRVRKSTGQVWRCRDGLSEMTLCKRLDGPLLVEECEV